MGLLSRLFGPKHTVYAEAVREALAPRIEALYQPAVRVIKHGNGRIRGSEGRRHALWVEAEAARDGRFDYCWLILQCG